MTTKIAMLCLILATLVFAPGPPALAGGDWNDKEIQWLTYDQGIEAAKKQNRPICLVFYTQWCPHCTNYATVFHDPKVVEEAKQFVMVRVDNDKNKSLGAKFAPDGTYIPRTFFLTPTGTLDRGIHAGMDQWKYFYDERDPASLLAGMATARRRHAPAPAAKSPN